ncbi:hypothetical protein NDU88_005461 [Pleurodeles waltl]|uniref:Uncharacterized protein n=1 Tax=Pleurodeles waltl TaxID=8319 RepID=A0AAV7WX37_PLEWA|nr:hypothetical protein NDU88_005461 [Pleurodeles waltl]
MIRQGLCANFQHAVFVPHCDVGDLFDTQERCVEILDRCCIDSVRRCVQFSVAGQVLSRFFTRKSGCVIPVQLCVDLVRLCLRPQGRCCIDSSLGSQAEPFRFGCAAIFSSQAGLCIVSSRLCVFFVLRLQKTGSRLNLSP